jgi:chromate reductase, NAD(P)H dehydrogenase (quinone)
VYNGPIGRHKLAAQKVIAMKQVLAIIGSATMHSANLHLVQQLAVLVQDRFKINIYNGLKQLPHFDPELSVGNTPPAVLDLRQRIADADGLIISTRILQ